MSVKRTKPHPELCDALLEGGFQTSASNFREVVRSTLTRHPDFEKINGQWGLAEWYGNRGRKAKRTDSQRTETDGEQADGSVSIGETGNNEVA